MPVDLHGYRIHDAWQEYRAVTADCYFKNKKHVVIITGQGQMSKEFIHWVAADPYAIRCEPVNTGNGAWKVYIKKKLPQPQISENPVTIDFSKLLSKFKS